ncbi:magnesium-transporting ATPase (P-type) [Oxalobacteraceae bacterium GrIS 2.11]
MRIVLKSYGRAFLMQFNLKMIVLSLLPSVLALVLWAVLLFFSLQPLIDFLQQDFVNSSSFQMAGNILTFFGLFVLKAFLVPLVAMWLLLPIMLFTALIFVACIAMPVINNTISKKYFPSLEKKRGASWWRSLGFAIVNFFVFLLIWFVSLPLILFLHLGVFIQPVLVGWFTYRVMTYDALAVHADFEERKQIMQQHRWQLWTVGIITGLLSALPGMVWLGGVLWIVALPFFAAIAIWLYVLVFMFSGIWFQLFCLDTLRHVREAKVTDMEDKLLPEIAS